MKKDTHDKTDETLRKVGDTLDFYNDSMPRKAVEGLFDKGGDDERVERVRITESEKSDILESLDLDFSLYSASKEKKRKIENRVREDIAEDEEEDDDEEEEEDERGSVFPKVAAGIAVVLVLVVFTALVVKMNTLNNQYKEAAKKIEDFEAEKSEINELRISNEGLSTEVDRLKNELAQVMGELDTRPVTTDGTTSEDNAVVVGGDVTYTVKSGDNLSKISKQFYGTLNDFKKIMDANGMTKESIFEGQVLIIPK